MIRLTKKLLEAIVYMAGSIEAGGSEDLQGFGGDRDAEQKGYFACLKAGDWAAQELRRREKRRPKS